MDRMYDKSRLIRNIRILAKAKNIKIGVLEKDSGLSRGYLARLEKNNDISPNIKTVCKIAEILGVSLDRLVYYDCATELYT